VNYLLDTNACIALINGRPPSVRARFQTATDRGAKIFVSSIAAFELWYGVAKSSLREFNRKRLEAFFAGPLHPLLFANEDAAMRNRLTLVTASLSEFARIKALTWTDWGKPEL
jgi:tRNA(fMet)-specific endonuclease VapC